MNFYASRGYLEVVAETYFPGRRTRIADVALGDVVLRLLVVDESRIVTEVPFLDYHQPLAAGEIGTVERWHGHAHAVVRTIIAEEERKDIAAGQLVAPYTDWSRFETHDSYLAFITARHPRQIGKLRRRRRRLEKTHGSLEFSADDTRDDVIDFALCRKSQQLRATGLDDLFADPRNVRFFAALRERGLLVASTLRVGGRLLSTLLGFVHEGIWSGWIFAYDRDPALRPYSLGNQLLQSILRHGHASGHREFDMSVGNQDYKWLYATHARVLGPVDGPPPSARLFLKMALQRVGLLDRARALRTAIHRPNAS